MALYQDPDGPRQRPSLIGDLLTIPAKATNHQIENQATTVLAWLADRSSVVAGGLLELLLPGIQVPAGTLGARSQLALSKPGGGAVFPDLSLDGAAGHLQVLVEIKVGTDFHVYEMPEGGSLPQPDYYRWAWRQQPARGEARLRAVGTLTRKGGQTDVDPDRLQARDVRWADLRDHLRTRLEDGRLEPEVRLVAASFLEAIVTQIAVEPPDPHELRIWLQRHRPVVDAVTARLQAMIPGSTATSTGGAEFVARRLRIPDVLGRPLVLRVYATPAGSGLTLPGWPDGLIVGVERDSDGDLDPAASVCFQQQGFLRRKDVLGYWLHRELWPMQDARRDPAAVAAQIAERVAASGLVTVR